MGNVLAASDLTDLRDMALILGEHKSVTTLGEKQKAITQLAYYYAGILTVHQPRNQHSHC